MPVLDHDIHPSTQIGDAYRWGCWNLDRNRYGYYHAASGRFVKDTFSRECRNDISLTDPFCRGCRWAGTGEAYAKKIQEQGR